MHIFYDNYDAFSNQGHFFPGVKKAVERKTVFWSNAFYAQYINLQMDFQKTNDVFSKNKKKLRKKKKHKKAKEKKK